MDHIIQCLGKVSITTNGDWDKNKQYDRLCLVFDNVTLASYVSKQKVPVGIEITNTDYWQVIVKSAGSIADENYINSIIDKYFSKGFPPAMLEQINTLLNEYFTEGDFRDDLIVLLGG